MTTDSTNNVYISGSQLFIMPTLTIDGGYSSVMDNATYTLDGCTADNNGTSASNELLKLLSSSDNVAGIGTVTGGGTINDGGTNSTNSTTTSNSTRPPTQPATHAPLDGVGAGAGLRMRMSKGDRLSEWWEGGGAKDVWHQVVLYAVPMERSVMVEEDVVAVRRWHFG